MKIPNLLILPAFISQFFKTKKFQQNIVICVYYSLYLSVTGKHIDNRTQGNGCQELSKRKYKQIGLVDYLKKKYFCISFEDNRHIIIYMNNSGSNKGSIQK